MIPMSHYIVGKLKTRLCHEGYLRLCKWVLKIFFFFLINHEFEFQGEELNRNGELYLQKHPNLRVKIVDGTSLVVGVVLNRIPKGTTKVVMRGKITKIGYAVAEVLCQRSIQVYHMSCIFLLFGVEPIMSATEPYDPTPRGFGSVA